MRFLSKARVSFFGITKSQFLTPRFISSASLYIGSAKRESSGSRSPERCGKFLLAHADRGHIDKQGGKKVYPADPLTHPPHRRQGFADPPARCTRA